MTSYRVGVIFGGRSPEHEVSIITALQVFGFLSDRYSIIPIYITKDGKWLTGGKLLDAATYRKLDLNDPELKSIIITPDSTIKVIRNPLGKGFWGKPEEVTIDVVFPVLHGSHGEDGTIQGLLELSNIPYIGSDHIASSICIDKEITKLTLIGAGVPVLDYLSFTRLEWEMQEDQVTEKITDKLNYPIIIKPAKLGSSIGISIANDIEELKFNISVASHYDTKILVEPYLENILEVNCSVLGYQNPRPSVCEQPISSGSILSFGDKYLQSNRTRGMEGAKRVIPAAISNELKEKVQELALTAFKIVGARGVARVDFIIELPMEKVYVNEINTIPGSLAYYLWEPSGIYPQQLVDELFEIAFQAHKEKSRNYYSQGQPLLQNIDLLKIRKD